jgi:transglutaminase-like putative cysteine protease
MGKISRFLGQFGIRELLVAAGLILFALALVFYKIYVLGYQVVQIRPEEGYEVSLTMDLQASGKDVRVTTFLPLQTDRQRIRREEQSSTGFEFSITPAREGIWEKENLDGSGQIEFTFFAQTEPRVFELPSGPLQPPQVDQQLVSSLEPSEDIQCEEEDIIAKAWQLMPDGISTPDAMRALFDFVYRDIAFKNIRGATDAITAYRLEQASCNGKNRLFIALCRARGIPARFAKGLILENTNKRTTHAWSEVYFDGRWIPFCPTNGYFAEIPEHYLELAKDDEALFKRTSSIGFDWAFAITPQVQGMEEAVQVNANNPLNLLSYWISLDESDVSIRLIMIILLIPIAASVVSFSRSIIGLHTFGTFMPSLIAVSFLQTGYVTGSLFFMTIMMMTGILNLALFKLRILHLPRLVIILTFVVMVVMAVSVLATKMGLPGAAGISLFPIAILSLTSERFSQTIQEDSWREAFNRTVVTYIVSAACYLVISRQDLQILVAAFPELLLLNIAFNILIGSWHGLRLAEYLRFSLLLRGKARA